jgi:hypothetical protein
MRNGYINAKALLWLIVALSSGIKALVAGILFTAVPEIDTPATRTTIWVFGMLIVFNIIYRITLMFKFQRKYKDNL